MKFKKLMAAHHLSAALWLAPVALTTMLAPLPAHAFEPVDAPVTVKVSPEVALVKSKVTLTGTSLIVGKNNEVTISVAPESGAAKPAPLTLKAKMDASGNFKTDFAADSEGKFKITVMAPDGKGSASTSLQVAAPLAAAGSSSASANALITTMQKGQSAGDAQIAALSPSPAKDEFQQKSAELKKKLAEIPAAQKHYEDALSKIYDLGAKYPESLPALKPLFDELATANEAIKAQNDSFEKRLAQGAKTNVQCDNIEAATEAFSAISTSMNMIGKPWGILKNWVIDKGPGKLVDTMNLPGDAAKFHATQSIKLSASVLIGGATGGPIAASAAVIGFAGDLGQFWTQLKFAKYCEKFEGPVYAQYRSEFRHKSKPYFTYKFDLRGKIQLRYAKDAARKADDPIALTGQIEGTLVTTEYAENAIIINPELSSRVLLRKVLGPPGVRYLEDIGTMARMALPQGFYIPVKGELHKGKITLNIEAATKDLSDVIQAQILYVFMEPSLPIPSVQQVKAPLEKAQFIFSRGMRAKPEFDVVTTKDKMQIEKTFKRTEDLKDADVFIEWKVDVKACNPGCLPSLYFSKAN